MKKLLALLLAVSMIFCLAACGGNSEETTTTAPVETTEAVADDEPIVENDATQAPASEETVDGTEAASTPEGEAGSEAASESTAPAIAEVPTEAADILAVYNTAINKAYDAKVGFNKERYTDNEALNAGFLLKTFGDLIYSFMGIGIENKYTMDVTKGQWESDVPHHYLRKSTLAESDITSAKCTENNGKYTIVFNVKPGNSKASKSESYNNSPIDKCGICVGDADKSYFDHKTAPVIYSAIGEVLSSAVIEESYKNAVVKAEIDTATGNLVNLTVEYDIDVVIDAVGGGNATGSTHIYYKNFKY